MTIAVYSLFTWWIYRDKTASRELMAHIFTAVTSDYESDEIAHIYNYGIAIKIAQSRLKNTG